MCWFATAENGLCIRPLSAVANRFAVLVKALAQLWRKTMANDAVTLPGERLAGLQIDLLQKLRAGILTLDDLALFTQIKNPFAVTTVTNFTVNEHGHVVFTITGLDLTGAQEEARLEAEKFNVWKYAKQILTSTNSDSYDRNHRLVGGQQYKIVLLPGKHIKSSERTTENLRTEASKLGYGKPVAGVIPRIREIVSDEKMEELGIWYIVALHDPIKDSDGGSNVLGSDNSDGGRLVGELRGQPDNQWLDGGAFAFFLPAS